MSEFSGLLSALIQSSDINVSALASYCGVDRSTMYKFINGKRNPSSAELIRKIEEYLQLNPAESQELSQAYEITRIGRDTYFSRKDIQEFILNFQDIQAPLGNVPSEGSVRTFGTDGNTVALNGRLAISSAIHSIFLQETASAAGEIAVLAQPEHLEALDAASLLSIFYGCLRIRHVICINNTKSIVPSQQNYNLQCLKKIIPYFGTGCSYQPVYFYDSVNSHFSSFNFMPCVFLTGHAAVICDSGLNSGYFFQSEELLNPIRRQFEKIWNETSPLMLSFRSSLDFHFNKFPAMLSASQDICNLGFDPCISPCITPELIEKYLRDDVPNRNNFLNLLENYFQSYSRCRMNTCFSRDGVLHFLKTGQISEIPSYLYRPLEYHDRIRLLRKFCLLPDTGRDIRMYKGSMENFPPNFHLSVSSSFGYLMFRNRNGQYSYLILEELNLRNAFYDFANSLDESGLLCSTAETIEYLQTLIQTKVGEN